MKKCLITLAIMINCQADISVVGNGAVSAAPDLSKLTFKVITKEADAKKSQEKNTKKMNKVIEDLKSKFSLETQDLKTTHYSLNPRYQYLQNQPPKLIGMEVVNEMTITIDELGKIPDIINFLSAKEVSEIGSIQFQIKDKSALEKEALRHAFKDAKEKAEVLAKQAKLSINNVKAISENVSTYQGPTPLRMEAKMMARPTIESGDITVNANISVTFKTD
ncbi:SIMPL domain-containing protein [Bacteriovorax sp. Seq25_V]|uniref:SIMPL domain-containing protein n=1 Tax=Bacteriovorax sp. Seq25_V TaxID=1201288 RepID=UPI00038A39D5|nr:SIMPL domain-containing protein [Bacteriovorax sp. Seq25_V]EQC44299.1 PF04402 family protein [Bacteriovorax sp. Seq25_V]